MKLTELNIKFRILFFILSLGLFGTVVTAVTPNDLVIGEETAVLPCYKNIYIEKNNGISAEEKNKGTQNNLLLYPGGMTFGLKFFTEGLMVVGFNDVDCESGSPTPASDAGLKVKDIIKSVDDVKVNTANDLIHILDTCGGREIKIVYQRGEEEFTAYLRPSLSVSEQKYKTGMWIRDSTAGIGTVTYIVPGTNAFGGLGHGICDPDTGELIPMTKGIVTDVTIRDIVQGQAGIPGELKGSFHSEKRGVLLRNTHCGVYGYFAELPQTITQQAIPAASANEVKNGEAYILCTLRDNTIHPYSIRISDIDHSGKSTKNFTVTVTDPRLLDETGGIVQGMSGSPIIQDGKLVGAVTHVLINDPTRGYGIFIENMLEAAG